MESCKKSLILVLLSIVIYIILINVPCIFLFMPKEFIFPDVGEGIHEGKIVKWHVKEGDSVKADSTIVDVETDKAIVELPSPATGIIKKINFPEGEIVKVGQSLVLISLPNEVSSSESSALSPTKIPLEHPTSIAKEIPAPPTHPSTLPIPGQILATPSTRKLARDLHVDLSKIQGTGSGGRITSDDVTKYSSGSLLQSLPTQLSGSSPSVSSQPIPISPSSLADTRIPLSGIRKVISDRMTYSKTHIPHACGMDFFDVTSLVEIREKEKKLLEKNSIKLTYLPFVIKACALSLKKFPYLNSNFDEKNSEILLKKNINIGIAVDTPDGLVVPVIRDCDLKSILVIAQEIEHLSSLARDKKLKLEDMRGGSFTITNIGSVGGFFSTPIINAPEVAILGIHRIKDMPLVVDGLVVPRKVLGVSICFDHRVIDGAVATEFVNELKKYLEDPALMLLGLI